MTTMQATAARDIILDVGADRTISGVNVQVGKIKEGVSVRRSATERLKQHGNYSEPGKRGARLVTVDGIFWDDTPEGAARAEDMLRGVLADGEVGRLIKKTVLGDRWAYCYLFGTPDVALDTETDGDFSIDFECPDPRWYGDLVSLQTGVQKSGGGLQLEPAFGPPQTVTYRRNVLENPNLLVDATGWAPFANGGTPTGARVATGGPDAATPAFYRVTANAAYSWLQAVSVAPGRNLVTPGTVYTMFGKMRTSLAGATIGLYVQWLDSAGAVITTTSAAAGTVSGANAWQSWSFTTAAAPAGAVRAQLLYRANGSYPSGGTLDVTAAMLADGPGGYFDGGTTDVPGTTTAVHFNWADTPGASVSVEATTLYSAGAGGFLNFGEGGSPGTITWTNTGTADVSPVFKVSDAAGFTITEVETQRRIIYRGTVLAGQYVDVDANDATVNLNGLDDRSSELTLAQWPVIPGGATRTYMLESITPTANLEMQVYPAWW